MIKCESGAFEVKGSTTELLSDLSMIIKCLREAFGEECIPKKEGDELIRKAVEVGFWTEDKLNEELKNIRAKLAGELLGAFLKYTFNEGENDE